MAQTKSSTVDAITREEFDALKTQADSIQNLAEVTHKAVTDLSTSFKEFTATVADSDEETDIDKLQIVWDYVQTFNTLLNHGGIGNSVSEQAELALQEILDRGEED
jgi:hypothetical protein